MYQLQRERLFHYLDGHPRCLWSPWHWGQRYQDISLQLPGPEGEKLFCGGGTWERLTLLCLGRAGQSTLLCPACPQLGQLLVVGAELGKYFPVVSVTIIQVKTLCCPVIFSADLGVTARIWESVSQLAGQFPCSAAGYCFFKAGERPARVLQVSALLDM